MLILSDSEPEMAFGQLIQDHLFKIISSTKLNLMCTLPIPRLSSGGVGMMQLHQQDEYC